MPQDPINRRTVVFGIAGGAAALWAADATFPGDQESTLKALARVVLPQSLGRAKSGRVGDEIHPLGAGLHARGLRWNTVTDLPSWRRVRRHAGSEVCRAVERAGGQRILSP